MSRFGPATSKVPSSTLRLTMWKRSLRSSTAAASSLLKSERTREAVSCPTATAKPHRITNVRTDDTTASRQRIGMRLSPEDISRAADGVQQPCLAPRLQLAPQVGHEHLDGVRGGERVVAPDLLEEALAGDDDALVAHEVLEQLELALGEVHRAIRAAHLVRVGVEGQVAHDERRRAARGAPAQQGPQAGQELLTLERLDEVVVGPGVEPLDARLDGVAGGQHQDRHVVGGAQAARDLDAVEAGQPEVEDDEIGVVG